MTEFRTIDDVQADFRRLDPSFTQITSASQLFGVAQLLDGTTSGPTLFNLGVIDGPEWEGVTRFLNSRLVSTTVRREVDQLRRDLQAADTDHDGFLNNQEIVAYAQAHAARYPNVITFRSAADLVLNRLPSYLAQPNLNNDQIAHLWGVMNRLASEWDQAGADSSQRGLVYGLSLVGFPSTDQRNPPSLIRRAQLGQLNPDELAAIHHILQVQTTDQGYNFQNGSAPMNPLEVGALSLILDRAAQAHHSFRGMTLVTGDAETQLYTERNRSLTDCHTAVQRAAQSTDAAAVDSAYSDCATALNRVETDQNAHPDQIGIHDILLRARAGVLTPAETAALRTWMQEEAQALGIAQAGCSGALECFGQGALIGLRELVTNPHNLAFIGMNYAYHYMLRRNFENRFRQLCPGFDDEMARRMEEYNRLSPRDRARTPDPRAAFYNQFSQSIMNRLPGFQRLLYRLVRNPGFESFWGKALLNFPTTVGHLLVFSHVIGPALNGASDAIADPRTHPYLNEALRYAGDGLAVFLLNGWGTYDNFNSAALSRYAQANPGMCRPQPQTSEQTAEAPAPEQVNASQMAPLTDDQLRALSRDQLLEHVRGPYGQMTQQQFEDFMNAGSPALTPAQIGQLSPDAQVLFESDEGHYWGISIDAHRDALNRALGTEGAPPLAETLVQQYAADNPELAASIRSDLQQFADTYRTRESAVQEPRVNAYRWALRDYIQNLQAGNMMHAAGYLPHIQLDGLVRTYFTIRETQQCVGFSVKDHAITFDEAATQHWNSAVSSTFNRLHPETWTHSTSTSSDDAPMLMPDGRPMPIFIPLPCGLAGSAVSGASGLIRSLFGLGEAAEETAPAWGYGAAAFAGGA